MFELYYENDGHGGPYFTKPEAIKAAKRLLKGYKTIRAIEIRPKTSKAIGAYAFNNLGSFYVRKF